jgi:hypothetical protein
MLETALPPAMKLRLLSIALRPSPPKAIILLRERGLTMNVPRSKKFLLLVFAGALLPIGLKADAAPDATPAAVNTTDPFAYADFGWLNGNLHGSDPTPADSKYFTPEIIVDANFAHSFNQPNDHTIVGSTSMGRSDEFQVQQLGVGGDMHVDNVHGRIFSDWGMDSQMVPRNDTSPGRGQWNLGSAYGTNLAEAYGGYHWDVLHGINLDAGIFPSYIGLYSYYNPDNWTYQASYVSSNTPWFFNGVRLQVFPTNQLKTEFWLINGWQTYGVFNDKLAFGYQIKWANQAGWFSSVYNGYIGFDTPDSPNLMKLHSDNSWLLKDYDDPKSSFITKNAWSLTADIGGEQGAMGNGANSSTIPITMGPGPNEEAFFGAMLYNRTEFGKIGFTFGGGFVNNPGQYLLLVPPVNGATAANYGAQVTAYDEQPGQDINTIPNLLPGSSFIATDFEICMDYRPSPYLMYKLEFEHNESNIPYFAGEGGVTSTDGWQSQVGTGSAGGIGSGFTPDLVKTQNRVVLVMNIEIN